MVEKGKHAMRRERGWMGSGSQQLLLLLFNKKYYILLPLEPHSLSRFKFCDASLSVDARVAALVEQVELDEIAAQLTARYVSVSVFV